MPIGLQLFGPNMQIKGQAKVERDQKTELLLPQDINLC